MGNEAFRSSRHSATAAFRRTSSRRHSKSSGQNYTAEDAEVIDRTHSTQATAQADSNTASGAITTPKPTRRMDKLRRSLTFRRKKKSSDNKKLATSSTANTASNSTNKNAEQTSTITTDNQTNQSTNNNNNNNQPIRPQLWIEDDKKVRAGNCSFQVKYLGYQEVSDSRGMHICELAIERLISEKDKHKQIKAILYVSGDSLRVVDESNKTLLVDQTIEKVSFCAPDRHHENGFAYICRDGTARRWLCHGFLAIKDTLKGAGPGCTGGERLSHAVGCAFSVCLERKQKRERENVSMEVGPNHSFTRFGSFRQASLTERFEDPQMVIPAVEPVPIKHVENPHAIERPKPSQDAFQRQNSLRSSGQLQLPFKRNAAGYSSLKPGELPSFQQQKLESGLSLTNKMTKTSLLTQNKQQQQQQIQNEQINNESINSNSNNMIQNVQIPQSDTLTKISEMPEIVEKQVDDIMNLNSVNKVSEELSWGLNLNDVQKSTVFNTPVTPSLSQVNNTIPSQLSTPPPPLPPMPVQYMGNLTPTPMMYQNSPMITNGYYQQTVHPMMITTPQIVLMPQQTQTQQSLSGQQNETFEQKWARLKAAKNTNPFAEDIAKKYEIKL